MRVNIRTHVVYNLRSVLKSYLWTCNDGPLTAVSTRDDDIWWKGVSKCKPQSEVDHLGNKRACEPNARLEKDCRSPPSFTGGGEETVGSRARLNEDPE